MNNSATFEAQTLNLHLPAGCALWAYLRLCIVKRLRRKINTILQHDIREHSYKESDCVF